MPVVFQAALAVGIRPAAASLKSLLSCCAELESRQGRSPLGQATGAGIDLPGGGHLDLAQVLKTCDDTMGELSTMQHGSSLHCDLAVPTPADPAECSTGSIGSSGSGRGSSYLRYRIAADFLRTAAFHSTFASVEQVMSQGAAWQLTRPVQPAAAATPQAGGC